MTRQFSLWDLDQERSRAWRLWLAEQPPADQVAWDQRIEVGEEPVGVGLPPGFVWHNGVALRSAHSAGWGRGLSPTQRRLAGEGRHPGSGAPIGPVGTRCADCIHFRRRSKWFKCELRATESRATDIRAGWRGCVHWAVEEAE